MKLHEDLNELANLCESSGFVGVYNTGTEMGWVRASGDSLLRGPVKVFATAAEAKKAATEKAKGLARKPAPGRALPAPAPSKRDREVINALWGRINAAYSTDVDEIMAIEKKLGFRGHSKAEYQKAMKYLVKAGWVKR
jgi:hypothetical protein